MNYKVLMIAGLAIISAISAIEIRAEETIGTDKTGLELQDTRYTLDLRTAYSVEASDNEAANFQIAITDNEIADQGFKRRRFDYETAGNLFGFFLPVIVVAVLFIPVM